MRSDAAEAAQGTNPVDERIALVSHSKPMQLTGLERVSQIMIDKLTTVRRINLGQQIGRIDSKTMLAVEQSLAVFLGLGR